MWDLIKNDPILKAISVFVLGIFSFSFAFSIMFGAGQGGMEQGVMEHGASSSGYNAANGLGQIIVLLSKVLIIIILIAIIIAVVKLIKRHIVNNEPTKVIENLKGKPLSAILLGITGIVILLYMVSMVLPYAGGNNMMSSNLNYSYNNYAFGITAILTSIVKFAIALSIIGLITGLVMYFKNQYFTNLKTGSAVSKEMCSICGHELKDKWKCCPICGTESDTNS